MPKISELIPGTTPTGHELIPANQGGSTISLTAGQIADLSNAARFPGLTGEVTSPFGSLITTINKSLTPTWLGVHTFSAGLKAGPVGQPLPNAAVVGYFNGLVPDVNTIVVIDSYANNPATRGTLAFYRAAGTGAAPVALPAGYDLGAVNAFGFDGVRYSGVADARMRYMTAEAWTATAHGAQISLETTAIGGALGNPLPRISIGGSGGVRIGGPFVDPGGDGNLSVANSLGVGADFGVSGNAGIVGTLNVGDHLTAERMTVGAPPSSDTGPGDIYLTGGIGVNVGVVGAEGTVNAAEGYYIDGSKALVRDASGAPVYHTLCNPDGLPAIKIGNSGDPSSTYDNTFHVFRDVSGAPSFAFLYSEGLIVTKGIVAGSSTPGGAMGVGTINAVSYFVNGAPLATVVAEMVQEAMRSK